MNLICNFKNYWAALFLFLASISFCGCNQEGIKMANKDDILIDDIEATFRNAYRRYRRSDPVGQDEMFGTLEKAAKEWVVAQRKLFEEDERATQELINQMRKVKHDIDDAANTQELIIAFGRLVAFLPAL